MIERQESTSPNAAGCGLAAVAAALAEFRIDNTQCLVVVEDSELGRRMQADGNAAALRLGRIDLGGRAYAIYAKAPERRATPPVQDPLSSLTARELQIVRLVCMGCVNKQIAHRLQISEYTVKTYLKQIFCKLNVHSRSAMVYRCAAWAKTEPAVAVE